MEGDKHKCMAGGGRKAEWLIVQDNVPQAE